MNQFFFHTIQRHSHLAASETVAWPDSVVIRPVGNCATWSPCKLQEKKAITCKSPPACEEKFKKTTAAAVITFVPPYKLG